jgi:N-acetylglutamate synthase-like GNAT family acetyltransferase
MPINIRGPTKLNIEKKILKNIVPNNIVLRSAFNFSFRTRTNRNYAIYNNETLVGFALTTNERPNGLTLNFIAVKPKLGYGKKLLNRIKLNAKKNGFNRINLSSVNTAMNFYKKQGFQKTPRTLLQTNLTYFF